jgi:hypothetical protein
VFVPPVKEVRPPALTVKAVKLGFYHRTGYSHFAKPVSQIAQHTEQETLIVGANN